MGHLAGQNRQGDHNWKMGVVVQSIWKHYNLKSRAGTVCLFKQKIEAVSLDAD